jgi:hypothetical protein
LPDLIALRHFRAMRHIAARQTRRAAAMFAAATALRYYAAPELYACRDARVMPDA